MWKRPWNLKEGFMIGLGLIIVGLLLQFTVGPVIWQIFAWPVNVYLLALIIILLLLAFAYCGKIYAFSFLSSWQSAVPALAYALVLTIAMGVTHQVAENTPPTDPIGLSKMLSFWPFVLVYLWMAVIIGLVTLRQVAHFSWSYFPALVSHLGLFIVMVCGTLGSADMQRLRMYCELGKPEWRALDSNNKTIELPIAIQLNKFIMEEYPPKLMLIDNKSQQTIMKDGQPMTIVVDSAFKSGRLGDWEIMLEDRKSDDVITVKAVNIKNPKQTGEGIVSCGNYMMPPQMIALGEQYTLAMPIRDPKRYASEVEVMTEKGAHLQATIDVNKPLSIEGWKIYQYSYNTRMGKWSNYSVFEFVTDPWLPVVYVGIGLLVIGALGLLFTAKHSKDKSGSDE